MNNKKADIGVFGGSGFYSFLDEVDEFYINTPYGNPSSKIALADIKGKKVAFLPRHGKDHQFPPHMVPYRANIYAMKELGVKAIIAPTASGSLKPDIKPGEFVVCDQFVDRTYDRKSTFFDGPITKHISSADPYCEELRKIAIQTARGLDISVHEKGTVVVVQGPRFSTRAESQWFTKMGWDVVNMTQYPECILAKEMGICYVNISLITDYDAGLVGHADIKPVTEQEVYRVFNENNEKVKKLIYTMIAKMDDDWSCKCSQA
ncbi:MAG: S-methyl-5'-thioadenosine phosphorylase [Clostridia bacterium]|nr:S-methyl-5'-thioadenosine phosphorylase [Clostridia bacterium]